MAGVRSFSATCVGPSASTELGELAPGERISPAEVGRRFGVSAMPVRDALRLLEQDGLVEMASRRWTRVVELSLEQAQELVPLVSLLEQYAVSNATAASDENLERLRRANEAFRRAIEDSDAAALVRADAEFHDTLVELAANASLVRALRDARTRIRLFRPQVVWAPVGCGFGQRSPAHHRLPRGGRFLRCRRCGRGELAA